MSAYVISDVEILDAAAMARYRAIAAPSIALYGGRYLFRGDAVEAAEGSPTPTYFVMLEFPSLERLHAWYESAEYAPALEISRTALRRRLLFVDGDASL